jgi:DNA polymerase I-like protein with 3'-5' exonuclease and polymerase domains
MLDFVSHEPRVALGIAGVDAPEDIYTWFRDEHCESVSRDNAKVAIIGTLYGMSSSTLAEKLDTNLVQARAISEIVRSTFGIKTLEAALLEEIRREGHIRSHFGRRIVPSSTAPGVLVNSYLQSTAMDLGMAGFRQVLASLAGSMIEVSPLFYIHDAMVVEVSDRRLSEVVDLSHREITIPGCPGTYRFKVKELTS